MEYKCKKQCYYNNRLWRPGAILETTEKFKHSCFEPVKAGSANVKKASDGGKTAAFTAKLQELTGELEAARGAAKQAISRAEVLEKEKAALAGELEAAQAANAELIAKLENIDQLAETPKTGKSKKAEK